MATHDSEITPHDELAKSEEAFVASGSTCVCFRVRQHGRLLLKKQLLPALASDDRLRQALEKEFEIGYHLDHPHIPRYLEFHGGYLLMEYVDGVTLTTFCQRHPDYFKEKQKARQFSRELCSAVGYLHQHQVLHLDLKPDNILLTHIGNRGREGQRHLVLGAQDVHRTLCVGRGVVMGSALVVLYLPSEHPTAGHVLGEGAGHIRPDDCRDAFVGFKNSFCAYTQFSRPVVLVCIRIPREPTENADS